MPEQTYRNAAGHNNQGADLTESVWLGQPLEILKAVRPAGECVPITAEWGDPDKSVFQFAKQTYRIAVGWDNL